MRRISCVAVLVLALACGGGDPTAPPPPPPPPPAAVGSWNVLLNSVPGSGVSCVVPDVTMTLTAGANQSITGTFDGHGDLLACSSGGNAFIGPVGYGGISNGSEIGSTVYLDLGGPAFRLQGGVAGDTMGGQLSATITLSGSSGPVPFPVNGTWTAQRTSITLPAGVPAGINASLASQVIEQLDSTQLAATVVDKSGHAVTAPLTYTSSDTSIATVSSTGMVVAHGTRGVARIGVQTGLIARRLALVILPKPISISILPDPAVVHRTRSITLAPTALDATGAPIVGAAFTFTSSGAGIASVSPQGVVSTGTQTGVDTVTISSGSLQKQLPVTVIAVPLTISITSTPIALAPGESGQLIATVRDSVGLKIPSAPVTYASDQPGIASVDSLGVVNAHADGSAIITASIGTLSTQTRVWVGTAPSSQPAGRTMVAGRPWGVGTGASGAFYVSELSLGQVSRGNLPSFTLGGGTAIGGFALDVAFNPAGTLAFVAHNAANQVVVIDVAGDSVLRTIDFSPLVPISVAVAPDGQRLFVGTGFSVEILDATTFAVLASVPTGVVNHITVHPTLPLIYASGDVLVEINTSTGVVTRNFSRVPLVGTDQGSVVSTDGQRLYIANEGGVLRAWNLQSGQLQDSTRMAGSGFGLALSPNGQFLYAAHPSQGTVEVFDRLSLASVVIISTGGSPRRIAFDPATSLAVVTNEYGWVDFLH